ncbi:MAG: hypothetical protein ABI239_07805 [Aquihabitans sp.]
MRTTHRPVRSVAAVAVAASLMLGAAACGSDSDGAASASADKVESTTTMEMGTDSGSTDVASNSPASGLRSTLTAGLTEHVYLAGIAVYSAVNVPDDFDAAAATLDENSVALSEAITSVYGEDAGDAFLELWRAHIGMFVDYTNAKAAGDDKAAQAAQDELADYGVEFGDFIEGANPNLPSEAIQASLQEHVKTLSAAIDATVAGDADAFSDLRVAAGHMSMTAEALAGGISQQMPEKFGN